MRTINTNATVIPSAKNIRSAVGYVRVSTDMQAADGLSLDAQKSAIRDYCRIHYFNLVRIYEDIESGGKVNRAGLAGALQANADVLVILKFDRLSRSIKHFCEIFETHFSDGRRELVAIRESIRLDSALGRALVNILLVFAQMEREATGERTKESIAFIRRSGYHFGRAPYGSKAVQAPENPRYRILVDDPEEQIVLARIKSMLDSGIGLTAIAAQLTSEKISPPSGGQAWSKSLLYNLKARKGWHIGKPVNERAHSDEDAKAQMRQLRDQGNSYPAIARIMNELGYVPYKGAKYTESSVCRLVAGVKPAKVLPPREYCRSLIERNGANKISLAKLARALNDAGYLTPKGHANWWPAQVRELLRGNYDNYYSNRLAKLHQNEIAIEAL